MRAQQIVVARPINAQPVAADFRLEEIELPAPEAGELLVRTRALSLDPYVGSTLRGRHMGHDSGAPGTLVVGLGIGEILESQDGDFSPGDLIAAEIGWRDHAIVKAETARRVDATLTPLSLHLGVLGMPGLTAYAGMTHRAKARAGDKVLISSAAGPVGGTAGQIARIHGATKVVGIAGSPEKCALVEDKYGFDQCINYKEEGWQDKIANAFPEGIDVYWDNVGGELLNTALTNLALYGRVVLCGLASQYHVDDRPAGPNPGLYIGKRAELYGLVVYDFYGEQADYAAKAAQWIADGKLTYVEDVAQGLVAAPAQFEKLMRGENIGKTVVRLD